MGKNSNIDLLNRLTHECTKPFREDAFVLDKPYTAVFGANRMGKSSGSKRVDKLTVPLGQVWVIIDPHSSNREAKRIDKVVSRPLARMRTALSDRFRQLGALWQIF